MLGLSVHIGCCQSRVFQGRRALTCTGRTFHLPPAQLGREDGGRAGPGMWHLRGLAGTRGRLGGDAAALRTVAGQRAAESIMHVSSLLLAGLSLFKSAGSEVGLIRKSEPVVAAPQPEQEVQLQQAEAKRDRSKAELQEAEAKLEKAKNELEKAKNELEKAEAKLEKAEAKLEKAEANLKEAKATGTEEDVGLARHKVDSAQKGVDFALEGVASAQEGVTSSQKGVTSSQELVDACTKRLASLLKEPVAGWTLDTADSVYQLFKDKGWVPEQLPAPLRLVMTSEVLPKLRHREDAIRLLCETVSQRFENYLKGLLDKEKQPHLICFATAGTGKSRLAQDALPLLQEHVENRELCALLQNSTVSVHATFNGGTKFNSWDWENGAEAALSVRALASTSVSKSRRCISCGQSSCALHLTVSFWTSAAAAWLKTHRRELAAWTATIGASDHIDNRHDWLEVLDELVLDVVVRVHREEKVAAWIENLSAAGKDIYGNPLGKPPKDPAIKCQVCGRSIGASKFAPHLDKCMGKSSHPYVSLPVPLLSFNESDDILRELGLEDWANDGQVQQLLADIGGLPRLLEILFSSLRKLVERGQRPTNASWATVQHALMTFVKQRTGPVEEEVVHAIVRAALTRETVTYEDVAHGQQTWGDLERCGAVFLREQKQRCMVVEVPCLIIEGKVRNLKKRRLPDVVEALFRVPEPRFWEWRTWEKFNALFDGDGMVVGPARRRGLTDRIGCSLLPRRAGRPRHCQLGVWPQSQGRVPDFQSRPLQLVNSCEVLVRFGHEKWSRDVGARPRVAQERIIQEKSKILAAAETLGPGHRSMVAFFTNVDVPLAPVPFCAIVGGEQMRDFYSQTFAARAFLGGPSRRKGST
eukprot:g45664.t1